MSKRKGKALAAPSEPPPRTTKIEALIGLLRRPEGADVHQLAAATGWQLHSVRGAIAGTVKKKLGLVVQTEKVEGRTVYRVAS
jgi:hypothetical protein